MWNIIGLYHEAILAVLSMIVLIVLIIVMVQSVKLKKLRKNYLLMIGSVQNENMEQIITDLQNAVRHLQQEQQENARTIRQLEQKMRNMITHVGVHRFNAFSELGHDLSFSAAFVDEQKNGIVITGIHNRENTYVYAKPLSEGKSDYHLSPEEEQAVTQALDKGQD